MRNHKFLREGGVKIMKNYKTARKERKKRKKNVS